MVVICCDGHLYSHVMKHDETLQMNGQPWHKDGAHNKFQMLETLR